jgi:hypothetical protein
MRYFGTLTLALGMFLLAAPHARSQSKSPDDRNSTIVIVLKDGQRRSFPMSEIERIEFTTPAVQASNVGQGRFLGKWKVGDGMGGHFYITLERDGIAYKTLNSPHGTWAVVGGEAQITWEDGWRDAIRKVGDRYQKVAFSPGTTFSDTPNHTASAESVDRSPI